MNANAAKARLNFLHNSAHLVAQSSPTTSAFLQSRIDQLASGGIPLDPTSRLHEPSSRAGQELSLHHARHLNMCASCGYDLTSLRLQVEPDQKKGKSISVKAEDHEATRRLYVRCILCGARTVHETASPKKDRSIKRKAQLNTNATTNAQLIQETDATESTNRANASSHASTNASSRKRAKARKSNSLSAMLAKSKAEKEANEKGFGLDLMDLMKTTHS